jgi:SAM-dependent methyltransferase
MEDGGARSARWQSEAGSAAPLRVQLADDTLAADNAWRLACEGTALLWRGDFQNARHLLDAMMRRTDRKPRNGSRKARDDATRATLPLSPVEAFHRHRLTQSQRARTLAMLLIPLDADRTIPLRRAPDLRAALAEAWGPPDGAPAVVSLRELQGVIGAHEWHKKGVDVPGLGRSGYRKIHPDYGVFSPIRGEYVDLVARAPLGAIPLAFEIGVGTGVLSAVLARRGVPRIIATDVDPRALQCAKANLERLGVIDQVELRRQDLFPEGQAPLIVCNPPWIPARPGSPLERAVYDEGSRMLRGFLAGVGEHLSPGGEAWLILSDLAEHLGLRSRAELESWIAEGALAVLARDDIRPRHAKPLDPADALHAARRAELTSLWRLGRRTPPA